MKKGNTYQNIIQVDWTTITNEEMLTIRQSDQAHYERLIKSKDVPDINKISFALKLSAVKEEITHRVAILNNPSAYWACDVCGNSYEECECDTIN